MVHWPIDTAAVPVDHPSDEIPTIQGCFTALQELQAEGNNPNSQLLLSPFGFTPL